MTLQAVGIGSSANDGNGDTLRSGATKINANFTEIYAAIGNGSALTDIIDGNEFWGEHNCVLLCELE